MSAAAFEPPKRNLSAILERVTGAKAQEKAAAGGAAAEMTPDVLPAAPVREPKMHKSYRTVQYINDALEDLGGKAFFVKLGRTNPEKFADVVAKTLPKTLEIEDGSGLMQMLAEQTTRARALLVAQAKREAQIVDAREAARVVDTQ